MNVKDLQKLGWDADIIHQRFVDEYTGDFASRGGRTIAVLTNHDRTAVFSGAALCSPVDNYCKKTGRNIAMSRALVQAIKKDGRLAELVCQSIGV